MALWTYPENRYYYGWYGEGLPPVPPGRPTDGDVKSQIVDRLRDNPHTADCKLQVVVKHGVVILNGVVDSRLAKRSAGDDCWDTPGVVDVSNQLEVAQGDASNRDDRGTVSSYMTPDPLVVDARTPVAEAARMMADRDVGDVLVSRDGSLEGIVTDRDLVVRVMAEGLDPVATAVSVVCTGGVVTAAPEEAVERVVERMRDGAIRRIAVVDHGQPVGVVSLGDLARRRDPGSALADISAAPPSH